MSIFEIRKRRYIVAGGIVMRRPGRNQMFIVSDATNDFLDNDERVLDRARYIHVTFFDDDRKQMFEIDARL